MKPLVEYRRVAVASAALALAIIFCLIAAQFEPRFAQAAGYAAGFIVFAIAVRRSAQPARLEVIAPYVVAGLIAYLIGIVLTEIRWNSGLAPYVMQAAAIVVFFIVSQLIVEMKPVISSATLEKPLSDAVAAIQRARPSLVELLAAIFELGRDVRIGRIFLGLVFVVLLVGDFRALSEFTKTIDSRADIEVYNRVDTWIAAAKCFKESGVILSVCEGGKFTPIENTSMADDRGQGLLLGVLHRYFSVPATKKSLVVLNAALSVVAFGLLSWQIGRMGRVIAGVLLFMISFRIIGSGYLHSDVPSTFMALFALSLLLPIQTIRMLFFSKQSLREWLWLAAAAIAMIWVLLLREPTGMIGILISTICLIIGVVWNRFRLGLARWVVCGAVLGSMVLSMNAAQLLLAYRSAFQGVPASGAVISHGIAHNLYIGLGSDPNPFGIVWDDDFARRAALKVDPNNRYGSTEYFKIVRDLYLDIVIKHPMEVARIYASRASRVLVPGILPPMCVLLASIFAGLAWQRHQGHAQPFDSVVATVAVVIAGGALLQALQSILTIVAPWFYYAANLGIYALAALTADIWYRIVWRDVVPVKP